MEPPDWALGLPFAVAFCLGILVAIWRDGFNQAQRFQVRDKRLIWPQRLGLIAGWGFGSAVIVGFGAWIVITGVYWFIDQDPGPIVVGVVVAVAVVVVGLIGVRVAWSC